MKHRLTSLPLQLIFFLVLPLLVLLLVVALGSVALHQAAMRDMLATHNKEIVSGTAASFSEQIEQRRVALQQLAGNSTDSENSNQAIETFFDGGVALYTERGRLLTASQRETDWNAVWQITQRGGGDTSIVALVTDGQNDTRIAIRFTSPPNAKVVVGIVSLRALGIFDILASLHTSATTTAYLVGTDGRILYHSDPISVGSFTAHFQEVGTLPAEGQSVYQKDDQGREIIVTSAPISVTGWTLVQEEQWQKTLSPLLRYSQAAPLVLVPGLLLTLVAVWFGIQRIVYPLQRLEDQATNLDWGDFAAIEQSVGGIKEIKQLQATLRHMVQRIQRTQAGMHNYIAAITRAQEDERMRLARELHDQTAQSLVALNHRVQMLAPYLRDDDETTELMSETHSMIMQTIDDLRRVVRALRPVYLEELGLVPALQMLVRDLDPEKQMTIEFKKTGAPQRLSPEDEIALYRIAQEALNNAWRHSAAKQVRLSVQFEDNQITVLVRDNGQGFAVPRHAIELTESGQGHFGIVGMYERAALIGAHLQIQSELGSGTTVTIRTPIR